MEIQAIDPEGSTAIAFLTGQLEQAYGFFF